MDRKEKFYALRKRRCPSFRGLYTEDIEKFIENAKAYFILERISYKDRLTKLWQMLKEDAQEYCANFIDPSTKVEEVFYHLRNRYSEPWYKKQKVRDLYHRSTPQFRPAHLHRSTNPPCNNVKHCKKGLENREPFLKQEHFKVAIPLNMIILPKLCKGAGSGESSQLTPQVSGKRKVHRQSSKSKKDIQSEPPEKAIPSIQQYPEKEFEEFFARVTSPESFSLYQDSLKNHPTKVEQKTTLAAAAKKQYSVNEFELFYCSMISSDV